MKQVYRVVVLKSFKPNRSSPFEFIYIITNYKNLFNFKCKFIHIATNRMCAVAKYNLDFPKYGQYIHLKA